MARITIEDCLENVPSRFSLVHIASQRARRLLKGAAPLVKTDNKIVVTALREIAAGMVTVDTGEKAKVAAGKTAPTEALATGKSAAEAVEEAAVEETEA